MVGRETGWVSFTVCPDTKKETLQAVVTEGTAKEATVFTDENRPYLWFESEEESRERKAVNHENAIDAPLGRAGRYPPVRRSLDGSFRLKKSRFVVRLLVCQRDESWYANATNQPYGLLSPSIIWCGLRNTGSGFSVAIFENG